MESNCPLPPEDEIDEIADEGHTDGTPEAASNGQGPPKKRRRRGSRGGRGRKKPAGAGAGSPGADAGTGTPEQESLSGGPSPSGSLSGGEDWNDAAADRGFTDDDIAEQALEDAGLVPSGGLSPSGGTGRSPVPPV